MRTAGNANWIQSIASVVRRGRHTLERQLAFLLLQFSYRDTNGAKIFWELATLWQHRPIRRCRLHGIPSMAVWGGGLDRDPGEIANWVRSSPHLYRWQCLDG